ncbi:MAG: hypothetical protein K9I48_03280 [Sphingobacteriales bacterium]|nr:hypothetical protein [Sphingobacteriales bacterium]
MSIIILGAFTTEKPSTDIELLNYNSPEQLDDSSKLSFALFSDNQGSSPYDDIHMAKMNKWMSEAKVSFVVGVGDHIMQQNGRNFLQFLMRDAWWYNNFYPTIADAENAYFGKSQADLNSGGKLLNLMNFKKRAGVELRKNNSEYYALKEVNGYRIHIITLHFPDQPANDSAFSADSKAFMVSKLNSITKSKKDIVIVNAHSRFGFWIDNLNAAQKSVLMNKADLVLSGTTHYFEKYLSDAKAENKRTPLIINCGSPAYAKFGSHNGYVQVNLLNKDQGLVAQYVNLDKAERTLATAKETYIKHINGKVKRVMFNNYYAAN